MKPRTYRPRSPRCSCGHPENQHTGPGHECRTVVRAADGTRSRCTCDGYVYDHP